MPERPWRIEPPPSELSDQQLEQIQAVIDAEWASRTQRRQILADLRRTRRRRARGFRVVE